MIIKLALLLVCTAFAVFLLVDYLLWLAIPALPNILTQVGIALFILAAVLLLSAGVFMILKLILTALSTYLSTQQRLHRRLLFSDAKQQQLKQLFYFRSVQLNYFNDLKRKNLLRANNKAHLKALSAAINKDLKQLKKELSTVHYQQLQQTHQQCLKQHDVNALLKLQSDIATLNLTDDV